MKLKSTSRKPLKITVWDKDDDEIHLSPFTKKFWKDEADDFLCQVTFTVEDLLDQLRQSPERCFKKWYDLQKRTRRSHVSGSIHLQFFLLSDVSGLQKEYQQHQQQVREQEVRLMNAVAVPTVIAEEQTKSLVHFVDEKAVYMHVLRSSLLPLKIIPFGTATSQLYG
jgi:hypothetical protein